ncbi:MAG TPA: Ig-like domain-containing protein [Gemmatimonadales bacterium]|jgi:hypothetical protein
MPAPVALLASALLAAAQGLEPLRKSDLVWLLSGSALTQQEIAQLVRRNCLTFVPTERDRQDLRSLGAEPDVLGAVDGCARRRVSAQPAAAPRPPAPQPAVTRPIPGRPAPPPVPAAPPPPPPASAARSGFVEGGGQGGAAGARLPRALVFELRDAAGAPLAGQTVTFAGINARIAPAAVSTDATGRVRVGVTLGERVGSATVIAAVGVVEKQVAFNVAAGPAAQIVVACGPTGTSLAGRFTIRPDSVVDLRVTARDAFGNAAPLAGLRAAAADAQIFRIVRAAEDGHLALKPDRAGTTSLAVIANGMRQYLTVTVMPRGAREPVDCR